MKYWASLIAQLVKNPPAMQETPFDSWVWKICWRRDRQPTPLFLGFPCGSAGKESICNVGDLGSIPGLGRSSGEGKGYPLQYCGLENSMDYSPWGRKESDMIERLSFYVLGLPIMKLCTLASRPGDRDQGTLLSLWHPSFKCKQQGLFLACFFHHRASILWMNWANNCPMTGVVWKKGEFCWPYLSGT